MSQSLGERLREAREAKGLSIGDVAEQTRISALYLESIENNDYKPLPGGIFNKGFVKSYAKFVGVDENEALAEYQRLNYVPVSDEEETFKTYRPEVLTDDNSGRSMIPSAILAVVALGILTAGVLFFVDYMKRPAEVVTTNPTPTPAANSDGPQTESQTPANTDPVPEMANLKVEIKTSDRPFDIRGTLDGEEIRRTVKQNEPIELSPKQELTLNYSRWNATTAELLLNGESIALPSEPLDAKDRDRIIFAISKDTLPQIWARRSIVAGTATPTPTPEQIAVDGSAAADATPTPVAPVAIPARTPVKTPVPQTRNTAQPSNSAEPRTTDPQRPAASNAQRPATPVNRPPATPRPTAANRGAASNRPNQ